jgi:putative salt-induced outer membrane protein YdiY
VYTKKILHPAIACCCLLFFIGSTGAQESVINIPVENADKEYMENTFKWETSKPTAIDFDWVQLVSGEWLKGEIKGLYKDKLEFDSDKLDLLTLDWEDVKHVETHIPGSAHIEDHGRVYGFFEINQKKIIVTNGDDVKEYDRSRLVSFITGGEEEMDYWSAKITLGLIVRSGNTDQVDYNAKANIRRQTSFSRFILDYIGNISNTKDVETINNHRVTATSDRFKTRQFFWRPIFGEYYSDKFSNIDSRITVGTGLGYTIIDTSRTDWDVAGGPGYQQTRFISVLPGENIKESTPALVVGTTYDFEVTKKIDFLFDYNITWVNSSSGGYTHHMVTTLESEITGSFDFDISFVWDHISEPTAADDGTVPLSDDYRTTLGISYEF